jgi:hypothetical protein
MNAARKKIDTSYYAFLPEGVSTIKSKGVESFYYNFSYVAKLDLSEKYITLVYLKTPRANQSSARFWYVVVTYSESGEFISSIDLASKVMSKNGYIHISGAIEKNLSIVCTYDEVALRKSKPVSVTKGTLHYSIQDNGVIR